MKLLTVEDVAEILQKSPDWVYHQWKAQNLPFRKVGGELRMRATDLEAWIDRLQVGSAR